MKQQQQQQQQQHVQVVRWINDRWMSNIIVPGRYDPQYGWDDDNTIS